MHRQIIPQEVDSAPLVDDLPLYLPSCGPNSRARLPSWGSLAHRLREPMMTDRDPTPGDDPARRRELWASPATCVS